MSAARAGTAKGGSTTAKKAPSRTAGGIPAPYGDRVARLRGLLTERELDGYLVWDSMDQFWLTGFTGEDGGVLVTSRQVILLTDGRFDEAADQEAPWARKVLRQTRTPEENAKLVRQYKIDKLGFDPAHLTVGEFTELRKAVKPTTLASAAGLVLGLRLIKDAGEVAAIERAIRVAEQAYEQLCEWLEPGMTEREVAARLVYDMQRLGASGPSFAPIVAAGATGSLPHYAPGDRKVSKREGLLLDWGCRVNGYVSDLTRVVWPGSIPPRLGKVYEIVLEAQERAIAAIAPGVPTSEVDARAREHIVAAGYGPQFNHSVGHGMGLDVHEAPGMRKTSKDVLRPGMVVTVEPGIYLPGEGGVRIEDDVLVTEDGYRVLSRLGKQLRSLAG